MNLQNNNGVACFRLVLEEDRDVDVLRLQEVVEMAQTAGSDADLFLCLLVA